MAFIVGYYFYALSSGHEMAVRDGYLSYKTNVWTGPYVEVGHCWREAAL